MTAAMKTTDKENHVHIRSKAACWAN